jgi:chemotaxis protein CheX
MIDTKTATANGMAEDTATGVDPRIEQALSTPPPSIPKAEHLEPFVAAARDVLEQELASQVAAGKLALATGTSTTHEVSTIIGITGDLTGMALYGMSEQTALKIVGQIMGAPCDELDDLALSGIGELANVITGCATTLLAQSGLAVDIAPPILLQGAGSRVSTAGIRRLVMPLLTPLGTVEVQLAIREHR